MARSIGSLPLRKVAGRTRWLPTIVALALAAVVVEPAAAQSRLNKMIDVLANNGVAVGTISSNRDISVIQALRALPLDWVFIDMEHSPFDPTVARSVIANFRAPDGTFPVTPLLRIPANCSEVEYNQWMFKQVLDGGAFGVIVAHCDKRQYAFNAAVAMRYPPFKNDDAPKPRGVRGAGGAPAVWGLSFAQYAQKADLWPLDPDGELLLMVMVESVESINNLEAILKVPGVGAAFIGPADLHADMGYAGQGGVPEVETQIQRALRIAQRVGVPIGITTSAADVRRRLAEGFRIVTIASDASIPAIEAGLRAIGR